MLYLDHSATTPPFPEVIDVVADVMRKYYGNPSSLHQLGVKAEQVLQQAREVAANLLKVHKDEIIFTSGATESNNLAIKGVAYQYRSRGNHLITSRIEHPSVYEVFQQLEQEGFRVTYLPVDAMGKVSVSDLTNALTDETILVSVMYVNNEVGTIQPIQEIAAVLKQHRKVYFHVDAVQAYGKIEANLCVDGVDLLSLSGHKFHGPRGTGILFKRRSLRLHPLITGGGQQEAVRPGTENLPGIVGLVKAMRMVEDGKHQDVPHMQSLQNKLCTYLSSATQSGITINTPIEHSASHIVNVSVPGLKAEALIHALEDQGYYVSTRSACSSKKIEPSRVLAAMGRSREDAESSVRISLSPAIPMDAIEPFADAFIRTVSQFKKVMQKH